MTVKAYWGRNKTKRERPSPATDSRGDSNGSIRPFCRGTADYRCDFLFMPVRDPVADLSSLPPYFIYVLRFRFEKIWSLRYRPCSKTLNFFAHVIMLSFLGIATVSSALHIRP
jgi:hypothetical protein